MYKEFSKRNGKETNDKKKILAKDLNRHFTKEYLTNKHENM